MAFTIDPTPEEGLEFDLPGADGSVTVPFLDCISPKVLTELDKELKENGVPGDHPESTRYLLRLVVEPKEHLGAVDDLTVRQLVQISQIWDKESEASMGESLGSTSSSKKKKA